MAENPNIVVGTRIANLGSGPKPRAPGGDEMILDVVCRMEIDENLSKLCLVVGERTYCFCSEAWRAEFDRNRVDYLIVTGPKVSSGSIEEDTEVVNV
jgi:YHS domain-containing protein